MAVDRTNNAAQQDILEILEKRYRIHSTVFCSQFDVAGWSVMLSGGALADAIMNRIISKSQTIKRFLVRSQREADKQKQSWMYFI